MAAEEQGVSPFPKPPSLYYKLYTDDNVRSGLAPQPPAPVKGQYSTFGAPFDTEDPLIRSLESQGITRLYPVNHDKKAELKKLNRSILICFLELLDTLIANPSSARNQKIKDLTDLFINMHHLINEFRPHQARETLKVVLERQRKQRDEMIVQVQRATEQARGKLKEFTETLNESMSNLQQSEGMTASKNSSLGSTSLEVEKMDTSTNAGDPVLSSLDTEFKSLVKEKQEFVELQDSELCNLIDTLITGTPPL